MNTGIGVTGLLPICRKGDIILHRIITYLLCLALLILAGAQVYAQDDLGSTSGILEYRTPKYLYATFYEYGLQVFDVADPINSENIGGFITGRQQAVDVEVVGDYAYVADGRGGMQIYNVSDPAEIQLTADFLRPCDARAIAVETPYAYIAAADSLQIYNVSDPENAFWITTYETDFKYDQAIDVFDGYAYVACGVDGIRVLDVHDPANAFEAGKVIPSGMARDVTVSGGYAYVAAGAGGLQIVDISSPQDPVVVGSGTRAGELTDGVFVEGKYAYLADRNTGLHIIDISDPYAPSEISVLKVKGKASDVFVMGGYAFVAAMSGDISIVDVSLPDKPVLLNWLRWSGTARSVYALD